MATAGSIQDHLGAGMRARQSGRTSEARRHFEAVIAIDPTQPVARNVLGLDAIANGDLRAGADHLEHACRGDPNAPELWINLSSAYKALENADAERAALEKALALDQRYLPALIRVAELHERLGQDAAAAERWSNVLAVTASLDQSSPEMQQLLTHARDYVARQREGLASALEKALADDLATASTRENRRVHAAADVMSGRRRVFVNECHGLHYPFLPADEFFDRDHFPWLEQLEAGTDEIRRELRAILANPDPGLLPYITQPSGVPKNKWTPLDRSLDWSALHLWLDGNRVDEACARAPKTAALVDLLPLCRIPGRAPAVFFSILRAGKHIPPHTGVTNVRSIVHLALIVPEGCTFRVGGETRPWVEGEAFVFDDTIEHDAHNPTAEDRAVLIIDTWNPYLSETERTAICRMYEVMDAQQIR
jgi:aspartyl/asparaginyl beta-hydroxylase (cupin superfamily)/Tfp pilus assembly protein PilF